MYENMLNNEPMNIALMGPSHAFRSGYHNCIEENPLAVLAPEDLRGAIAEVDVKVHDSDALDAPLEPRVHHADGDVVDEAEAR